MRVVVIGSGCAGIVTGVMLAKSGYKVTILEMNDFLGGRCSDIVVNGNRFDRGPSIWVLKDMYHKVFDRIDPEFKNMIELIKCEPNYTIHNEAESITLHTDQNIMRKILRRFGESFTKYQTFLKRISGYDKVLSDTFLQSFYKNVCDFFMKILSVISSLDIHLSEYQVVSQYFKTKIFNRAFSFGSMYFGTSPYSAPAPYLMLQSKELTEGAMYPKQGMYHMLEQMVGLSTCKGHDLKIIKNAKVMDIQGIDKQTKTISYCDRDENVISIDTDIVVSNADLVYTYRKLFPDTMVNRIVHKSIESSDYSCSTISFYWSIKIPDNFKSLKLSVNNLFLNGDYKGSFDDIFRRNTIPEHPSFYLNIPWLVDKSANQGNDSCIPIVILVPVGPKFLVHYRDSQNGYQDMINRVRRYVMECIKLKVGLDIERHLVEEKVMDPLAWKTDLGLAHGSALGLNHGMFQTGWFRHPLYTGHKDVYVVGSGTQLGIGVPTCMLSGIFLHDLIVSGDWFSKMYDRINYYLWVAWCIVRYYLTNSVLCDIIQYIKNRIM